MATNKINTANFTKKVENAIKTVKSKANKANYYALNATEEVVTETISIATQWQQVTDKALKGGVKLLDNQQNLIFDTLESYKKHFVKGSKRLRKVFA
ncbi:hypothetical protein [Polaribacter marinivivus]|uniref:Phasin domain-containing protein n=1 Tax=Polaribacter marinivivus TaxID=1524260 RepID=A0ABV8RCV8_9FLAO